MHIGDSSVHFTLLLLPSSVHSLANTEFSNIKTLDSEKVCDFLILMCNDYMISLLIIKDVRNDMKKIVDVYYEVWG